MNLAIIQARCNSRRFPKKILKKIYKKELLKILIERLKTSKSINKIIIATSKNIINKPLVQFCKKNNISCFQGSENNVFSRYLKIARSETPKLIIRLTADCPFVDPNVIDHLVSKIQKGKYEFVSNTVPPTSSTWPDGSDVEIFTFKAILKIDQKSMTKQDKEHVTFQFWKSAKFKKCQIHMKRNNARFRYTLDYKEDLFVIRKIASYFKDYLKTVTTEQIIAFLKKNPKIANKNKKYYFGIGWEQK